MGYRKSPNFAKSKDCKPNYVIFMLGSMIAKRLTGKAMRKPSRRIMQHL
jgi:hypothetical protein